MARPRVERSVSTLSEDEFQLIGSSSKTKASRATHVSRQAPEAVRSPRSTKTPRKPRIAKDSQAARAALPPDHIDHLQAAETFSSASVLISRAQEADSFIVVHGGEQGLELAHPQQASEVGLIGGLYNAAVVATTGVVQTITTSSFSLLGYNESYYAQLNQDDVIKKCNELFMSAGKAYQAALTHYHYQVPIINGEPSLESALPHLHYSIAEINAEQIRFFRTMANLQDKMREKASSRLLGYLVQLDSFSILKALNSDNNLHQESCEYAAVAIDHLDKLLKCNYVVACHKEKAIEEELNGEFKRRIRDKKIEEFNELKANIFEKHKRPATTIKTEEEECLGFQIYVDFGALSVDHYDGLEGDELYDALENDYLAMRKGYEGIIAILGKCHDYSVRLIRMHDGCLLEDGCGFHQIWGHHIEAFDAKLRTSHEFNLRDKLIANELIIRCINDLQMPDVDAQGKIVKHAYEKILDRLGKFVEKPQPDAVSGRVIDTAESEIRKVLESNRDGYGLKIIESILTVVTGGVWLKARLLFASKSSFWRSHGADHIDEIRDLKTSTYRNLRT